MKAKKFINYQGSKSAIIDFIMNGIEEFVNPGDTVCDIFSGSGAVSAALSEKFNVIANDVEPYSSTLNKAILIDSSVDQKNINDIMITARNHNNFLIGEEGIREFIVREKNNIENKNLIDILDLYREFQTVWNSDSLSPEKLRKDKKYNLFTRYYSGSYFGISQATEIDSLIYSINQANEESVDLLFACLFYAMSETSFSRDGHFAHPLNFETNSNRGFLFRSKSVFDLFEKKIREIYEETKNNNNVNNKHTVYNENFETLILDEEFMNSVDLIYADPPYTDMQYSRYYHLLNVARQYDYPELTETNRGFTAGLYTEGRFQSKLSQKSNAKDLIELIMEQTYKYGKILALSYAYPRDLKAEAVDRYTV